MSRKITAEMITSGEVGAEEIAGEIAGLMDLRAGYMNYLADVSLLTPEQIIVYAVSIYRAEAAAGGHERFLIEPSGMLWREAIAGLDVIGCERAADNLREVRDKFAPELPFEQAQRVSLIEENDLSFGQEDSIFTEESQKIAERLEKYVKENAEALEFPGI